MAKRPSRRKETLQQKVDRLNGYHVNEHDYLFDRLFVSLKREIEQSDKHLVCRGGSYQIEVKQVKSAPVTYGWLDAIVHQG